MVEINPSGSEGMERGSGSYVPPMSDKPLDLRVTRDMPAPDSQPKAIPLIRPPEGRGQAQPELPGRQEATSSRIILPPSVLYDAYDRVTERPDFQWQPQELGAGDAFSAVRYGGYVALNPLSEDPSRRIRDVEDKVHDLSAGKDLHPNLQQVVAASVQDEPRAIVKYIPGKTVNQATTGDFATITDEQYRQTFEACEAMQEGGISISNDPTDFIINPHTGINVVSYAAMPRDTADRQQFGQKIGVFAELIGKGGGPSDRLMTQPEQFEAVAQEAQDRIAELQRFREIGLDRYHRAGARLINLVARSTTDQIKENGRVTQLYRNPIFQAKERAANRKLLDNQA
jgi:hypothetical protein